MSFTATRWARRQATGGAHGKVLLLVLADHADEAGYCFPGQDLLAEECECSVRAVREWLAKLEAAGLIRRERRLREDGHRTSDGITLAMDLPAPTAGEADLPAVGAGDIPAGGAGVIPADGAEPTGTTCRVIYQGNLPEKDRGTRARTKAPNKGSRVGDFAPDIAVAIAKGMTERWARSEAEQFVDYWRGVAGRHGVKLDWPATWRNRIAALIERHGPGDGPRGSYGARGAPPNAPSPRHGMDSLTRVIARARAKETPSHVAIEHDDHPAGDDG